MTLALKKNKQTEKVKGYLWFRVVVIKVIVGAVVGVAGLVQQLYCQRSAEGLGHEWVLERQEGRATG